MANLAAVLVMDQHGMQPAAYPASLAMMNTAASVN